MAPGLARIEWLLLAFAAGVWSAQQRSTLLEHALALGICAVGTFGVLWARFRTYGVIGANAWRAGALLFLSAVIGFAYATVRAQSRLSDALDLDLEARLLLVEGVVSTMPTRTIDGIRFHFDVQRVREPVTGQLPQRLSVSWSYTLRGDGVPELRAGERWLLALHVRRPHGFANPHGFDLEAWMFERNLRAIGTVIAAETVHQRLSADAGRWQDRIERWRERTRDRMLAALPGERWAGVLVALAIGDQASIARDDWSTFNAAGISHLLSISGAHVTLFAAALAACTFALWRRSHPLTLRLPARKAAIVVSVIAAFAYAAFAGFAPPAQRTCFMLAVVALCYWRDAAPRASVALGMALGGVLLLDPWAVLAAGFWFSFIAVAVLLWLAAYRVGPVGWWKAAVAAQAAVFIALAPVGLALFQQVSLVGVLINAIAIPVVSLLVVPLLLAWLVVPWDGLLALAHLSFGAIAWLCERARDLPLATWQQHAPPAWTVVLAMVGGFWLIAPRSWIGKPLAVILLLPLFVFKPTRPAWGGFTLTALDVGQGLAMVVQTHSFDLLYDAGPSWTDQSDAGQRIVVPYLRATGARLGGMVVSHEDSDHAGGVPAVRRERPPQWVRSSYARTPEERCVAGERWEWDGVRFAFVHPSARMYDSKRKSNDVSCVLRIEGSDGSSALLTGDVEALAEHEMVGGTAQLSAALLTVPHHGSLTSSTDSFIAAVSPQRAIVNAGYRNRFGHPRPEVLQRYLRRNIPVDRTDLHGAVKYVWRDGQWLPERWREANRRYWHHAP